MLINQSTVLWEVNQVAVTDGSALPTTPVTDDSGWLNLTPTAIADVHGTIQLLGKIDWGAATPDATFKLAIWIDLPEGGLWGFGDSGQPISPNGQGQIVGFSTGSPNADMFMSQRISMSASSASGNLPAIQFKAIAYLSGACKLTVTS